MHHYCLVRMPNRGNLANINITPTEIYAARVYLFIAHSLFNCLIVYCLFILMDALINFAERPYVQPWESCKRRGVDLSCPVFLPSVSSTATTRCRQQRTHFRWHCSQVICQGKGQDFTKQRFLETEWKRRTDRISHFLSFPFKLDLVGLGGGRAEEW